MTLRCHKELNVDTNIDAQLITKASHLVSSLMNMPVQPNKAIVGRNAFAHSSGIHQDGVLKDRQTYEIIDPQDVGLNQSVIALTARSGRAALVHRLELLGYNLTQEETDDTYAKFLELADRKKEIHDYDLLYLVGDIDRMKQQSVSLKFLQVTTGTLVPTATVVLKFGDHERMAIATATARWMRPYRPSRPSSTRRSCSRNSSCRPSPRGRTTWAAYTCRCSAAAARSTDSPPTRTPRGRRSRRSSTRCAY